MRPGLRPFVLAGLGVLTGCQAFVNSDPVGGIGAPCARETECQASQCIEGLCTMPCKVTADCPEGTICGAKTCQLPLKAAWIYEDDPGLEQWTAAHELGRQAAAKLPYLTAAKAFLNVKDTPTLAKTLDQAVGEGFDVVIATSPDFAKTVDDKSKQYPLTHFLACGSPFTSASESSFYGRDYKAWYLAGKAAAIRSAKGRLGIVGGFVSPTAVRNINAFTLGALSQTPDVKVEVRWAHAWVDVFTTDSKFAVLADELSLTGCDVIAHQGYKGFTVEEVENKLPGVSAIGNNVVNACDGKSRCFGTVYWNWGPLYAGMLNAVHNAASAAVPASFYADIDVNPDNSVVNFSSTDPNVAGPVGMELANIAATPGVGTFFSVQFCSTEMTPRCFNQGATPVPVDDNVLNTMCFFIGAGIAPDLTGVVEKTDATNPVSADKPAQVPPEGGCTPPPPM